MCLTTRLKKPFIAKKDIVCYKELLLSGKDYVTPYQHVPVELNQIMEAGTDRSYEGEEWNRYDKHGIYDGFIHAWLKPNLCYFVSSSERGFKAIIPAGTEFYISDDCTEICARKMFITDEEVKLASTTNLNNIVNGVMKDYLSEIFVDIVPGVGIGYLYFSDGRYVNPKDFSEEDKDKVIGIVSDVSDGTIKIVGMESLTGVSENLKYPIFDICSKYKTDGTEAGEWYMGAFSEVHRMSLNMFQINLSILLTGHISTIYYDYYLTSTKVDGHRVQFVFTETGFGFPDYIYKIQPLNFRPFLSRKIK